jgi:hypothetical protein
MSNEAIGITITSSHVLQGLFPSGLISFSEAWQAFVAERDAWLNPDIA